MTKRERSRLWREARAAAGGRVLLTLDQAIARMHCGGARETEGRHVPVWKLLEV
jgi:hypothetical protein